MHLLGGQLKTMNNAHHTLLYFFKTHTHIADPKQKLSKDKTETPKNEVKACLNLP